MFGLKLSIEQCVVHGSILINVYEIINKIAREMV